VNNNFTGFLLPVKDHSIVEITAPAPGCD